MSLWSKKLPFVLGLLLPSIAWAGGTAVVAPFISKGVDAKITKNVTGLVSSELDFSGAFDRVNELEDVPSSLNVACLSSTTCLQGIAKVGSADAVVTGSIAPGSAGVQIYMIYYDVKKNAIIRKKTYDVPSDPSVLAERAGTWIKELTTGQSVEAVAAAEALPTFSSSDEDDLEIGGSNPSGTVTKTRMSSDINPGELTEEEDPEEARQSAAAVKAAADAKAKASAAAQARAAADAKARSDAEAKARAAEIAAANARAAAEAKARADADARAQAEASARAKAAADAKARADAAARSSSAKSTAAQPAEEEFSFGSATSSIQVEDELVALDDEDEDEDPAPSRSSDLDDEDLDAPATKKSKTPTSRTISKAEQEEDEDLDSRSKSSSRSSDDEDEDLDSGSSRSRTSSNDDDDDDDEDSGSSRARTSSRSSSDDEDEDEDDDSSSRSSSSRSRSSASHPAEKPGIGVTGRVGYSRYYDFNFVTYGGELTVPITPNIMFEAGLEGFSCQRELTAKVVEELAQQNNVSPEEINAQPWNTILPFNLGLQYKVTQSSIRPYVGADLTITPYSAAFDIALGARVRVGADFMLADVFGLNLNFSGGVMSGKNLENTQPGTKNTGIIPQISGGTVFAF